ncbi:MAG: type II toxin-antitoxin system VapC family toxin [Leptospiraceae bacterium]|nr:type II toxin-antitoxin system VapC family toxin [Leptospiraceae bacterium]
MKAVFDTNILIDFLNGKPAAKQELEAYDKKFISIITYIEILVGSESDEETLLLKNFLSNFKLIPVNKNLSLLAVEARQKYKLKIPDAIIWASAETEETILVTRDKVFPVNSPMVRVPY